MSSLRVALCGLAVVVALSCSSSPSESDGGSTGGGSGGGGASATGGGSASGGGAATGGGSATGGGAATGGGTATGGGSSGGGSGGGGATLDGGQTCSELANDYAQALTAAKACDPSGPASQCGMKVVQTLGCSCETFVNDTSQLSPIASAWAMEGCHVECPQIACQLVTQGQCTSSNGGGECIDLH